MIEARFDISAAMAQLSQIESRATKLTALQASLTAAGAPIVAAAKAMVQQPGKAGYSKRYGQRKTLKHLRDTIGSVGRIYQSSVVVVAGPMYPAGASGHLVERGHRLAHGGTLWRVRKPAKARIGSDGLLVSNQKRFANRKSTRISYGAAESRVTKIRGGGRVVGKTRPFPFVEPAFNATVEQSQRAAVDALQAHISQAVGGA